MYIHCIYDQRFPSCCSVVIFYSINSTNLMYNKLLINFLNKLYMIWWYYWNSFAVHHYFHSKYTYLNIYMFKYVYIFKYLYLNMYILICIFIYVYLNMHIYFMKRKQLYIQRNIFKISLNHTEIRLYLPSSNWFGRW